MDATCRGCGKKGHYEKVCLQGKHSAHSLETPQMTSAGAGASEPLYFNDEGQPVYTYMVSVPHANKHLMRFPIAIEPMALRRKGTHADSSLSTPSVLLKADTGADVNLINRKTFNQLFDSKVFEAYTHQDGELWKFDSKSVRNVPCISQMEGMGLQTIILCDRL